MSKIENSRISALLIESSVLINDNVYYYISAASIF